MKSKERGEIDKGREGERGSDEIEREIEERETKGEREKEGAIISKERGEGEREREKMDETERGRES